MCVYIHTSIHIYGATVPLFLNSCEGPQAVCMWLHRPRVNLWAFCLFELGRNHKRIPLRLRQIPLKTPAQWGGSFPESLFSPAWQEHTLHLATAKGHSASPKILPLHPFPRGWVGPTREFPQRNSWNFSMGSAVPSLGIVTWLQVLQNCLKWSNSTNSVSFQGASISVYSAGPALEPLWITVPRVLLNVPLQAGICTH